MNGFSTTGSQLIDTVAKGLRWLDRQIAQIVTPPAPRQRMPAEMSDIQLQQDINDVGAVLMNGLQDIIKGSFVGDAAHGDLRFPHKMHTSVRGQTLTLFMQAHDAYGLTLRGLNAHATAAALGPIRNILETLAMTRWLLEGTDDQVRHARAYGLALDGIDQYGKVAWMLKQSAETRGYADKLVARAKQMEDDLNQLAQQDGITIERKPAKWSALVECYVSEFGRLSYAMLSSAGVHPGAIRSTLFYGRPGTGKVDYDFKGMHALRAYWIGQATGLYLELCQFVAPVLGWPPEWDEIQAATQTQRQPLADEAERRYSRPMLQALARASAV